MRTHIRRAAVAAAASMSVAALAAPAGQADSLVYVKGGNVWISHGDGSGAAQVTGQANNWSWPTEDDLGNILVAGGQGGVSAGMDDTPGSEIYRINQQGASLSTPQQTPGSLSTASCVTLAPQGLRVAPDGKHYAYDVFFCDHFITEIGTVGGGGFSGSEYMSDFVYPYWTSNSDFVASRGSVPFDDSDGEWWVHELGQSAGEGWNWFGDPATYAEPGNPNGWATGFDGIAVSPDGTKVVTVEDDGANWLDGAHQVALRFWSASGAPASADQSPPAPTFKCELDLGGDTPTPNYWYDSAGPSFSPDGTRVAFAEQDGIHIANVSNLNKCSSVTAPLVIPGGTQPFWSAADEAPNAGYVSPVNNGNNGNNGGNNGNNGNNSGSTTDTTPPTITALTVAPRRFAVRAVGRASVRYTLSEAAHVTFTIERSATGRKHHGKCVTATKRLARAPRCSLLQTIGTVTAAGASGQNKLVMPARVDRHKLVPGRYMLATTAVDAAGNRSATHSVGFTITAH